MQRFKTHHFVAALAFCAWARTFAQTPITVRDDTDTAGRMVVESHTRAGAQDRVAVFDGIVPLGVLQPDSEGRVRFLTPRLASGRHSLRFATWGSGESVGDPISIQVPALPAGGFAGPAVYPSGITPSVVAAADLGNTGRVDLITAGPGLVAILRNKGDGTFAVPAVLTAGSDPRAIAIADFDGNGLSDIAVADRNGQIAVFLNRGSTFAPSVTFAAGLNPSAFAVADFDRDGIADLAVSNEDGNSISLLLGNGDGTFRAATSIGAGIGPRSILAGDFNGDGIPDLATANFLSNDVTVLLGAGDGSFLPARAYPAGNGATSIVAGDFDEDGRPDLAVLNQLQGTVNILLGDTGGGFHPGSVLAVPAGGLTSPQATLNGDSHLDLVVSSGALRFEIGNGAGGFAEDMSGLSASASGQVVPPILTATAGSTWRRAVSAIGLTCDWRRLSPLKSGGRCPRRRRQRRSLVTMRVRNPRLVIPISLARTRVLYSSVKLTSDPMPCNWVMALASLRAKPGELHKLR